MKCRFVREYASYVKTKIMIADMPNDLKAVDAKRLDTLVSKVELGKMKVLTAMQILVKTDNNLTLYNTPWIPH